MSDEARAMEMLTSVILIAWATIIIVAWVMV